MYRVNAIMIIMTTSCTFAQLLVPYMNFVYIHGQIDNGRRCNNVRGNKATSTPPQPSEAYPRSKKCGAVFAVVIVVFILVTLTNIGMFYEHRCVAIAATSGITHSFPVLTVPCITV